MTSTTTARASRPSTGNVDAPDLARAIHTRRGPLVMLFYDGFELKAAEGLAGGLYSRGHGAARYLYRTLKGAQVWTGFYTAFRLLRTCLLQAGCDVRVNDFALARRHPHYPVGLAGYPSVLEKVRLPNPVIFGPGDYGLPDAAAVLVQDPRIRRLIQPCDWAADLYRRECGSKMMVWPVGIDTEMWEDMHGLPKDLDVVIYDKIRWDRETEVPRVLDRIKQGLRSAGLSFETIRYGHHHLSQFSGLLRRARAMVFVCEHETQGLACQEAMACNVPVLAWDEGVLVDPWQKKFAAPDLRVSSVPYFDGRCGERFQIADFEAVLAKFWSRLDSYQPRRFVEEELSLAQSAQSYLAAYGALLPRSPA
jgi:hypothetical protein